MGILLTPEHSHIVDSCRTLCAQAITYFNDHQDFRSMNLMARAYRERNEFPTGSPAYALCQVVIFEAEQMMGGGE